MTKSLIHKFAWTGAIIITLAVAIHLSLPLVVNTAAMRTRILSRATQEFPGVVNFGTIKPALLPRPCALVTQVRLSQAQKFDFQCSKAIIYPRLWPLFFGKLIIDHLTILKPDIEIILPNTGSLNQEDSRSQSVHAVESRIRDAVSAIFENLGLPAIRIKEGQLTLRRPRAEDLVFNRLNLRADVDGDWLTMHLSGHSNLLESFEFQERLDLSSLDGTGRLKISGLDTAHLAANDLTAKSTWLPGMLLDVDVAVQNRALQSFHFEIMAEAPDILARYGKRQLSAKDLLFKAGGQWTGERIRITHFLLHTGAPALDLNGSATWFLSDQKARLPVEIGLKSADLDIGPIRSAALQLAGDQQVVRNIFGIIRGGQVADLSIALDRPESSARDIGARFSLKGRLSDGLIVLPHNKLHLEAVGGRFELKKGRLRADHVSAHYGRSVARNGSLELGLMDDTRAFVLDTKIDVDLSEAVPLIKRFDTGAQDALAALDRLPEINGSAKGRLRLGDTLDRISGSLTVAAHLDVLDAALDISAAAIAWQPSALTGLQADLSGSIGSRAIEWLRQRGAVPDEFLVQAPVAADHAHLSWEAPDVLGVQGEFVTAAGMSLAMVLSISPDELDLKRLRLKDDLSDAVININHVRKGKKWHIGFSGRLDGSTASRILRPANIIVGWLEGDLQVDFQSAAPLLTEVRGRLDGRHINVPLGSRPGLSIVDATLAGHGSRIEITHAGLKWQQSTSRLTGSAAFTPKAMELDLALSADTLDVDKLMAAIKTGNTSGTGPLPMGDHVLPMRGRIRVQTDQLLFDGYRFAPVKGVITLKDQRADADLSVANLCGISIPGQIRYGQGGLQMRFNIHVSRTPLQDTDRCLAGVAVTERLEGTVSADGSLQTQGRTEEELTHNLTGQLNILISDGRMFNIGAAGFFTNLLSFISVHQLIQGKLPDLRMDDFQFKSLSSKLTLKNGRLRIEEGVLKSNAVNIVGHGDYLLDSKNLDLVLLVSPLTTVDWIIERIPLIGNILQGTLVAIPVGVKGPVVNPNVIPLSPSAVGSRLGGILERTIKTPFRILSPLMKGKPESNP